MKTYLNFGGGVNSVAMMLLMLDEGWEFEAVFVDHGCDWPDTYDYLKYFQGWLKDNKYKQVTVIKPNVEGFENLYNFCWYKEIVPWKMRRWCTEKFKIIPLQNHYKKPCFSCLGFAADESHRAKISVHNGVENKFPLIEAEMTRQDCIDYIEKHGLAVPAKSGCWFCPFQPNSQFRLLRMRYPDLYCKAKALEERAVLKWGNENALLKDKPLDIIINEAQGELWGEYKPPCYCGR